MSLISASQEENSNESNQFKISACIVHSSGALLLEEKDEHNLDRSLRRISSSDSSSMPFGSPKSLMLQQQQQQLQALNASLGLQTPGLNNVNQELQFSPMDDAAGFDFGGDDDGGAVGFAYDDNDSDGGSPLKMPESATKERHVTFADSAQVVYTEHETSFTSSSNSMNIDESQEVDMWRMLDPHDNGSVKLKPYRKGKTYRIPTIDDHTVAIQYTPDLVNMMNNDPTTNAILRTINKSALKAPYFNEFSSLYIGELTRRKKNK